MTYQVIERDLPRGFIEALEARDVQISNNAGWIIVDGYLGSVFEAIREYAGDLEVEGLL